VVVAGVSPGRLIASRYRILAEAGRGGMAVVYRAHDSQLDREVAIKIVQPDSESDTDFSNNLVREARAVAALPHPNVVTVFDAGEFDGLPYIAMEYVGGGDLRALLSKRGRLAPLEAARMAHDIARGLAAVHARGMVHCDVKPQNVLLTLEQTPKLVDFGISRGASGTTVSRPDEVMGSALYLSPEQVKGEPVDARTDVYALGIVLYELLAGRAPFNDSIPHHPR
jgi:serine/threonine protein kinase